jgi:kojibiose phosphorylase
MQDLKELLSAPEWLVEEKNFDVKKLNFYETIFTVGNGYLGTRGSLEEGHAAALQGTFLNGVYDHHQSFVVDLVNAPDWLGLSVYIDGEKLSVQTCEILNYLRILDMKNGLLFRETRFKDSKGRISKYQSIRFAHMSSVHLMDSYASITAENYSASISLEGSINANVVNLDVEPVFKTKTKFDPDVKWHKWAKSIHLDHVSGSLIEEGVYLEVKTKDRPHHIGYASSLSSSKKETTSAKKTDHKYALQLLSTDIDLGETIFFEKQVAIFTTRDVAKENVKSAAVSLLAENSQLSFQDRFTSHQQAWNAKWNACEVKIEGDETANHALKFNTYHLLITASPTDYYANIGAKSLSGEGYKGHVFWDTEIFMLPFYVFTQPETAKALMMYRYNTKEGARDYAKEGNHKGIRYPWESADTGHEVTPPWTSDGLIRIWTGERELHITSAVVFGLIYYYETTGDEDFLIDYASEILFETARFWESRLEHNTDLNRYELTEVEGPDEFHELVNNSVYTNALTKWNLEKSAEFYSILKASNPKKLKELSAKIKLQESEIDTWLDKASKVYIPFDPDKSLIEEFEGYFNLKDVPITEWDENDMPVYPKGYHHDNCQETTLLKQPDVLMLTYILPSMFSDEVKKANYDYYEPRTMHKSSLSPCIHTIMGIEVGNYEKALQYFERSVYVDLVDNQGNTNMGMHIASAGGSWQAVVSGFGGMRLKRGMLTFKPWLPPNWTSISFKLQWQGDVVHVILDPSEFLFHWETEKSGQLLIEVKDKPVALSANKEVRVSL